MKVKLTKKDKILFQSEVSKLNATDFLQLAEELGVIKEKFTASDWKFITSHMGRKADKFLRKAVKMGATYYD